MKKIHIHTLYTKAQRGVVLVTALIMLMVLTILAVTAMNTSTLQTLMAGNNQFQTVALSEAEVTVAAAETLLDGIVNKTQAAPAQGYYDISPTGTSTAIDFSTFGWPDGSVIASGDNSEYVIEYTGEKTLPPTSFKFINGSSTAGDKVHVFRITARSRQGRGAVRVVQSVYTTLDSPI